jgi:acyl-CoA thioester hydrolase
MQIRVYYEDTDTGGIVYHSQYLNFCERARSEAFFAKGMVPVLEEGHFVARKVIANYIASAKLGDMLDINTSLVKMRGASFTLLQTITKNEKKIFEMEITLAYISFDAKAQKIDAKTKALINSLF